VSKIAGTAVPTYLMISIVPSAVPQRLSILARAMAIA
jgi:hypothetical protein